MENDGQVILLTGGRSMGKTTVCQAVAELTRRRGYRPGGVITLALYDSHGMKVGLEALDVGSGQRWPLAYTDPSTGSGRGPSTILRQGSGQSRELGGPRVGPYSFDPTALARALRVLRRACPELVLSEACPELVLSEVEGQSRRVEGRSRRAVTTGCDLFMVDEIGPLELEQGEGFAPILDLIHWRSSRTARLSSPKSCSAPAERETSFATPEENSEDSLSGERPMHTLIVVRPSLLDQLLLHLRDTEPTVFSVTEGNRDELPPRIVEELWGIR